MKLGKLSVLLLAAAALSLSFGCASKPAPKPDAPAVTTAPATKTEQPAAQPSEISETPVVEAPAEKLTLKRVHFEFDQYVLDTDARANLENNAAYMSANSRVDIQIEGHCDERGSDSYNLALGEKRARAVMDYLVSLGTSARRLDIISYGEERPLAPGSTESAWAKNRRAEFIIR